MFALAARRLVGILAAIGFGETSVGALQRVTGVDDVGAVEPSAPPLRATICSTSSAPALARRVA
jgi:hypothetical protein